MDVTKGSAAATHIYEDFVPTSELVLAEDCDTLLIHLPGFKKEQLRVQLTKGIIRISGSMPIGDNKMRRFQKEFPVSPNCETNQITARFDNGILHVKQPKLIIPATSAAPEQQQKPTTTPSPAAQESNKPENEPRAKQNGLEKANGTEEGKKMYSEEEKNMEKVTRNEEKTEAKNDGEMKDEVSTRTDNYRKMMGKRLKMQRRVLHIFLAALFTCMITIYVKKLITSFRQPKN